MTTEDKYKAALANEARIKSQTNDKNQHSKAEQMTRAALDALTAEKEKNAPKISLMDILNGGRKKTP